MLTRLDPIEVGDNKVNICYCIINYSNCQLENHPKMATWIGGITCGYRYQPVIPHSIQRVMNHPVTGSRAPCLPGHLFNPGTPALNWSLFDRCKEGPGLSVVATHWNLQEGLSVAKVMGLPPNRPGSVFHTLSNHHIINDVPIGSKPPYHQTTISIQVYSRRGQSKPSKLSFAGFVYIYIDFT